MSLTSDMLSKRIAQLRGVYIMVFAALLSISYSVQVSALEMRWLSILYSSMAVFGVLILGLDFVNKQVLFSYKNCGLLVLFVVALLVSAVLNYRYGIMGNLKVAAWMCIQMFLMASVDMEQPESMHKKHLRMILDVFCVIWFVWACWSLVQFVLQYHETVSLSEFSTAKETGFTNGRLFGVFKDPNYASVCSIGAVVFTVEGIISSKKSVVRILFGCVQICVQVSYIILAASRTAQLALIAAIVLLALLLGWSFAEKYTKKIVWKCCCSIIVTALVVCVCVFGFKTVKAGLSYLPGLYLSAVEESPNPSVEVTPPPVSLDRTDVTGENVDISNNRFKIWSDYFKVYLSEPIFGVSPRNTLAYVNDNFPESFIAWRGYEVHNGYFALFVCTGVVGGLLMLCWLAMVVFEVVGYLIRRRGSGDTNYHSVLALTFFLVCCAVAAVPLQMIFFSNSIYDLLFWCVLGYVRYMVHLGEPERYAKKPFVYSVMQRVKKNWSGNNKETHPLI